MATTQLPLHDRIWTSLVVDRRYSVRYVIAQRLRFGDSGKLDFIPRRDGGCLGDPF